MCATAEIRMVYGFYPTSLSSPVPTKYETIFPELPFALILKGFNNLQTASRYKNAHPAGCVYKMCAKR